MALRMSFLRSALCDSTARMVDLRLACIPTVIIAISLMDGSCMTSPMRG